MKRCFCRRMISDNKEQCSHCAAGEPVETKAFIIVELRNADVDILFRSSDGRQVAQRKGGVVYYSETDEFPHGKMAAYLSRAHALAFMKETIAQREFERLGMTGPIEFEVRDGESKIVNAGDAHGARLNVALTH